MDHAVYLDTEGKELEKLLDGNKSMMILVAAGRKLPHGRVIEKDVLYFIRIYGHGLVKAKAIVKSVFNSEKMDKAESEALIEKNSNELNLSRKQNTRWAGKKYLVLIEVHEVEEIEPFGIDKSNYGNMDDWMPVENISSVKQE